MSNRFLDRFDQFADDTTHEEREHQYNMACDDADFKIKEKKEEEAMLLAEQMEQHNKQLYDLIESLKNLERQYNRMQQGYQVDISDIIADLKVSLEV